MNNKKIFLVNPTGHTLSALHVGYVASLLRNKGFNFEVIDLEPRSLLANYKKRLEKSNPGIIAIVTSLMNPCLNVQGEGISLKIAQITKEYNPYSIIIKDGISSTMFTEEILQTGLIDIAIMGESDFTFLEVISALIKDQDWEAIKGIAFKKGEEIVKTPPRDLIADLDSLPFPARVLLNRRHFLACKWHYVIVSRGCPFPCTICQPVTKRLFGLRARYRKPAKVVDEIEEILSDYPQIPLQFWGDTFTLDREWVIKFCDEIMKRQLKFHWLVGTRADCIDFDLAKRMKEAGCYEIGYGVEASCEELRNGLIKKNLSLKSIYKAIRINKSLGIVNRLAFIVGLPTKSLKQMLTNLLGNVKIILRTHPEWILLANASPIPGTELYDFALKKGILASSNKWQLNVGNFSKSSFKNVSAFRIRIEFITLVLAWLVANPRSILRVISSRWWKLWHRKAGDENWN